MPRSTKLNSALWVCLTLFCLAMLLLGLRISISSLYSLQASRFLDDWSSRKEEPQQQAWNIARSAIDRAIYWHPIANPNLLIKRGRIYDWRYYRKSIGDPIATESRLQALADYRRAAQLQPGWPYTWVDIALVKVRLGVVDQETLDSLENALSTGPWRPDVLLKMVETGLLAWDMLPLRGKTIVIKSIDRGLASTLDTSTQVSRSLNQFGRQRTICNRNNTFVNLADWCASQSKAKATPQVK